MLTERNKPSLKLLLKIMEGVPATIARNIFRLLDATISSREYTRLRDQPRIVDVRIVVPSRP